MYSAAAESNRFLLELEAQVSLRYIKEGDSNACLQAHCSAAVTKWAQLQLWAMCGRHDISIESR